MDRLVFIDDDEDELELMRGLVVGAYEYVPLHWPRQKPAEDLTGSPPDIFVSDLYLPPRDHGDHPIDHSKEVLEIQAAKAAGIGDCFRGLYPGPQHAKKRLKETMECLKRGRDLLDEQWAALGQSPDCGLELLRELKKNLTYGKVPFLAGSQ